MGLFSLFKKKGLLQAEEKDKKTGSFVSEAEAAYVQQCVEDLMGDNVIFDPRDYGDLVFKGAEQAVKDLGENWEIYKCPKETHRLVAGTKGEPSPTCSCGATMMPFG